MSFSYETDAFRVYSFDKWRAYTSESRLTAGAHLETALSAGFGLTHSGAQLDISTFAFTTRKMRLGVPVVFLFHFIFPDVG